MKFLKFASVRDVCKIVFFIFLAQAATKAQIQTTTSISSSANPPAPGQLITLTAIVSPPASGPVMFEDGFRILGTALLSGSSQATLLVRLTEARPYAIRAVYAGSTGAAASTSLPLRFFLKNKHVQSFSGNLPLPGILGFPGDTFFQDVNGDGNPDAIVGYNPLSAFAVHLGNGDGTFQPSETTANVNIVAFADFNNDGRIDALGSTSGTNGGTFLLLGNGDGSFGAPIALSLPSLTRASFVADLNRDGKADFITGTAIPPYSSNFNRMFGNGDGTFTRDSLSLPGVSQIADLNGDAIADSVAVNFQATGGGNGQNICTVEVNWGVKANSCGIADYSYVGDLNGDGLDDVITQTGHYSNVQNTQSFLAKADGSIGAPITVNTTASVLQLADWDGDGILDIIADQYATSSSVPDLVFLHGNGDGTFASAQVIASNFSSATKSFMDVNGDGYLDVVLAEDRVVFGSPLTTLTLTAPTATTFQPGIEQSYQALIVDAGGVASISKAYLRLTPSGDANACLVEITPSTGAVRLASDAGTGWITGTLTNTQCVVRTSGIAVNSGGNTVTITLPITINPGVLGPLTVSIRVVDASVDTGYVPQTSLTIPLPTPVSLTPSQGSGSSGMFDIRYATGYQASQPSPAVALVYILFGSTQSAANSCMVEFAPLTNSFRLATDKGTAFLGPMGAGTNANLSNGQCTVNGVGSGQAGSTVSGAFYYANFSLSVQFAPGFTGTQNVYMIAFPYGGSSGVWESMGTFTVTSAGGGGGGSLPSGTVPVCNPQGFPCVASLTPTNGSGLTGTFTGVFTHSGGASQHYLGYILFLPTPNVVNYTATGSCLVEYNRISNAMRLINDAGTNWLPLVIGLPVGQAGTLTNSHCTLNVGQSSALINGTTMTVNAAMTFNSGFTGQLATFMQAFDVTGAYTGMTQFGNWVAAPGPQAPGPYVVGVTPTSGAGPSSTLTFTAGHTSGVSSLSFVTMLISSVIVGGTPCQAFYFPAANVLNLVNDAGTAMVSNTGIAPGTTGTLSNSRCTINTGTATRTISGSNVTVSLPMTFSTANFGGAQNIYVNAFDNFGYLSHWVTGGTWTVQ